MMIDTKNHTVTIPAEDYNELMKAKDNIGIMELKPDNSSFDGVYMAFTQVNNLQYSGNQLTVEDMKKLIKVYYKLL